MVLNGGQQLRVFWPPNSLVSRSIQQQHTVDISLFLQIYHPIFRTFSLFRLQTLVENIPNNGDKYVELPSDIRTGCPGVSNGVGFSICPVFFKVEISGNQYLPTTISAWSGVAFLNNSISPQFTMLKCQLWNQSTFDSQRLNRLPPCPPLESTAQEDSSYQIEDMTSIVTGTREYHFLFMRYFHPTVGNCYRQSV